MLKIIVSRKLGIGFFLVSFCLIFLSCATTDNNTTQNGIEGVWVYERSYHGNKIILIFRDDKNGVMYMLDDRVSFQDANVRNETLAIANYQYAFMGNKLQLLFSDGKRYNNDCNLNKNGKSLVFDGFLNNLFEEFKFNKLNSKNEAIYLQIDKEKSGSTK